MKRLAETPQVDPTARVNASTLGPWTEVGARSVLHEVTLGAYSYVVHDANLAYTTTGKFCSIAAATRLNPGNHPLDRAALHHFTYRSAMFDLGPDDDDFFAWRRGTPVTLGHDVWIGHGAIVLPGVRVGTGAAIGAGAVVTKDVPDFAIMVGVPARVLRFRFPEEVRQALLAIAWWDFPHDRLRDVLADLRALDAAGFCRKYG